MTVQFAAKQDRGLNKALLGAAIGLGLLITYVDSRPNWDDTGITAIAVLISCGLLGVLEPKRAWLWALCVGIWIPLLGILSTHNYTSLLALIIAFIGAYLGVGVRKTLAHV